MKILYYDCFAGISGDMYLGAMIDLGIDISYLTAQLALLPVHGYELQVEKTLKNGISGIKVNVVIDEHHLHNHVSHQHPGHEKQHHHHQSYSEIKKMITGSSLSSNVKDISIAIFDRIAKAEAMIHDKPVDEVHFHEVGAIDSIVDIVGAAICIDKLAPDVVLCSTVELGGGFVDCAHGTYPVPAPATAEIVKNMPVRKGTVNYEATTPTGAAILAATVNKFTDNQEFRIIRTGYGIGSKETVIPNILRVFLCEGIAPFKNTVSPSLIIACNIDDMNPEFYDYIIDSLFSAGAKDVYITPIIMKKSRPAVKLTVLCLPEDETKINEVLFRETSTLGVRKYVVNKTVLERQVEEIQTRYGTIRVKSAFYQGICIKSKPEYDDCMKIAREKGIPISQVYREVEQVLGRKIESSETN
jgi:uncharacterized protein (TIGR00299 family) protein